jgi:hypothetical protein
MAKYCVICKRPIEKEEPAVLTMGGFGVPKCICGQCEETIDKMTTGTDYEEIIESCVSLGESLTRGDTGDNSVIATVNGLIKNASERAAKIKDGTYDFSLDEKSDDEDFEITEDIAETEEDRALDEKEAKANKVLDTILTWASGIIIVVAVVFFTIKMLF